MSGPIKSRKIPRVCTCSCCSPILNVLYVYYMLQSIQQHLTVNGSTPSDFLGGFHWPHYKCAETSVVDSIKHVPPICCCCSLYHCSYRVSAAACQGVLAKVSPILSTTAIVTNFSAESLSSRCCCVSFNVNLIFVITVKNVHCCCGSFIAGLYLLRPSFLRRKGGCFCVEGSTSEVCRTCWTVRELS